MTILSEGKHAAEFLVSEAPAARSRERITVLSGATLVAGAVLGKVTVGAATPAAFAGNAASTGTIASVTLGAGAKPGAYKVVIIEPAANAGNPKETRVSARPDAFVVPSTEDSWTRRWTLPKGRRLTTESWRYAPTFSPSVYRWRSRSASTTGPAGGMSLAMATPFSRNSGSTVAIASRATSPRSTALLVHSA